jgi:hypothetical protein
VIRSAKQIRTFTQPSHRPRWPVAVTLAVIIAGPLAACSGGGVATKTMTQAQATVRAQTLLGDTASALNPRPTLEVNELLTVTDMCVADIPNADHMVNVAYSYWLRDIPASGLPRADPPERVADPDRPVARCRCRSRQGAAHRAAGSGGLPL